MIPNLKLYLIGLAIAAALAGGGSLYCSIYNSGKKAVIVEQEKKLNTLKDKTNAAKTDALTTPNLDGELLKFSRPD